MFAWYAVIMNVIHEWRVCTVREWGLVLVEVNTVPVPSQACTIIVGLVSEWFMPNSTVSTNAPAGACCFARRAAVAHSRARCPLPDFGSILAGNAICNGDSICLKFMNEHGNAAARSLTAGETPDDFCSQVTLCPSNITCRVCVPPSCYVIGVHLMRCMSELASACSCGTRGR